MMKTNTREIGDAQRSDHGVHYRKISAMHEHSRSELDVTDDEERRNRLHFQRLRRDAVPWLSMVRRCFAVFDPDMISPLWIGLRARGRSHHLRTSWASIECERSHSCRHLCHRSGYVVIITTRVWILIQLPSDIDSVVINLLYRIGNAVVVNCNPSDRVIVVTVVIWELTAVLIRPYILVGLCGTSKSHLEVSFVICNYDVTDFQIIPPPIHRWIIEWRSSSLVLEHVSRGVIFFFFFNSSRSNIAWHYVVVMSWCQGEVGTHLCTLYLSPLRRVDGYMPPLWYSIAT